LGRCLRLCALQLSREVLSACDAIVGKSIHGLSLRPRLHSVTSA
jgi:hypothetical protein